MKKHPLFALAAMILLMPNRASAWGRKGHQMVATIGFGMLDSTTQQTIQKYLGNISVPAAGTWMDDMRNNPQYKYTKGWHFINIDKGSDYKASDDKDIVNEINNAIYNLKHRDNMSDVDIQFNILVLFHLIGDIAQPLHVGYGSDVGGNIVEVSFLGKSSNLHKVWDGEIIENQNITQENCLGLMNTIDDEQMDGIKEINPVTWLTQSRAQLEHVYAFSGGVIDNAYVAKNKTIVEKQVLYAGIRLATTLEDIFKEPVHAHLKSLKKQDRGLDTVILEHSYYRSHFVNSTHIPWIVEYKLRTQDVNCENKLKRKDNFAPDPFNKEATDLANDYKGTGYDRGHNMPAADNQCNGDAAMNECFYFSNMFPQTHRLNAGVWKTLEEQERDMAIKDDSIYVWIGSYGVDKKIGAKGVVVPKFCWKVIYDYKTKAWSAYIFPNTMTVSGKPSDFVTTVDDIRAKSGFEFR